MNSLRRTNTAATLLILFATTVGFSQNNNKDPKALVEKMVIACGTLEKLKSMKDVEYTYTYRSPSGEQDVSLERYLFDGEYSWAKYLTREKNVLANLKGTLVQGYNGSKTWLTLDGKPLTDKQMLRLADFLRKTNFYWFAMMFKLLDPGIIYSYDGTRAVNGTQYDLIKIEFEKGVGDVSDIYVLYLNPKTHLADRFLFTVLDFGVTEPLLMTVEYESVNGLLLPARRKYTASDWQGTIKEDSWTAEIMTDIKFNNGFAPTLFDPPSK